MIGGKDQHAGAGWDQRNRGARFAKVLAALLFSVMLSCTLVYIETLEGSCGRRSMKMPMVLSWA